MKLRRDLGLRLLALYLLFVGPVVLALLVFDHLAGQRLREEVKAADLALARAIALETDSAMDNALQAVRNLASYPAVQQAGHEGMLPVFRSFMSARSDVNLIYRLNADGIMLYHYPEAPGSTVGWDFSFREYYQLALTTRSPFLSVGRRSPTTEQLVTTAVMPLWDKGEFIGLVATNIKLQALSHTLASIASEYRPEEGFQVVIIDSAGQVIAHPKPPSLMEQWSDRLPGVTRTVLSGESGNVISDEEQAGEMLYSYAPLTRAGWGVIVSRPTAAAFVTPQAIHQGVLIAIWFFLLFGLIFWLGLSMQVIRPLERLAAFSRTIGDLTENHPYRQELDRVARRVDQIGHLARSLRSMERDIHARLNELSTLLETSAVVVSTLDPQTVLDRILEQVERLMDINMSAVVALDKNRGVFRAQATRGLSRRYTDQLAINPSEPLSVTLRALRSGEPIQISDTEEDPSFITSRPRSRAEGYRSLLAVPLNTQHAPPSALLLYRKEPHAYTESEINLLTSFANHAAMAIENAALYARSDMQVKEQTRRLEALIQSMQDGLILEDLDGRVLYANKRIGEILNLPLDDVIGVPATRLIDRFLSHLSNKDNEQHEKLRYTILAAIQGQGPRTIEIPLELAHRPLTLRLNVFDVTDAEGMPIGRGQFLRDITHRKEIDRMKTSLISTVSHELRTPLASIKGYATTLLADDVEWDSITQREFLSIISRESDRLSDLVNNLMDMSRLEAGNFTVSRSRCRLEDLVGRAAARAHPSPESRLEIHIPPDLPEIYLDPQRIEVVLRNLLENAAKYAGPEAHVQLTVTMENDDLVVRVVDDGPGIPLEDRERIFESFYRVESGLTRSTAGAGLGLAICRGFVHAHGGEIWVERGVKGVSVAFSLPLHPEDEVDTADEDVLTAAQTEAKAR